MRTLLGPVHRVGLYGTIVPVHADAGFPLLFNGIAGECMHAGAGPLPLPL